MKLRIRRDIFEPDFTLGSMYVDDDFLGYTCEDCDRRLESGGTKVHGETAIPRGKYRVVLSFSEKFRKYLPEVLGVPGFLGIRIHGGNDAADTLGCPLLGSERTDDGVKNCSGVNLHLVGLLEEAEHRKEECWLTVS